MKWKETPKPEWAPTVVEFFEIYQSILPSDKNHMARALNPSSLKPESTQWALLRASALFYCYHQSKEGMAFFPWWMAGRQLIQLKANSRHTIRGPPHTIIPSLYVAKKPNISFVKRFRFEQVLWPEDDDRIEEQEFEAEEGG